MTVKSCGKYILLACLFCSLSVVSDRSVHSSPEKEAYQRNQEGIAHMKAGRYKEAISSFKSAREYSPSNKTANKNLATAYNNYGFYLLKKGDNNSAIEQLENALYYEPEMPYTCYGLGQAYYGVQDMTNAKKYLEKAYRMKPGIKGLKELMRKVKGEERVEKKYKTLDTAHFIIGFSDDIPDTKLSYIKTYLEEAYGKICGMFDYYPDKKTVVVLYPEEVYMKLQKGTPEWSIGVFDGKIRLPINEKKYSDESVVRIIFHEYAHAVILDVSKGKCPQWFGEGLASKAEDLALPRDRDLIKKYLEKFGLIKISDVAKNMFRIQDRQRATLLYIEAYLFVDFIEKRFGQTGMRGIIDDIARGKNIVTAVESVSGESFNETEEKWANYVIDEYRIDVTNRR